jgi:two-component system, LytTR family, response regulator
VKTIKVAIADDEPLARERLRSLLEGRERYAIVVECVDGAEALAALTQHDIDLLFLDVQMPGLDGFQTLDSLSSGLLPMIVFVTAFNDYALRAFDVSALDYLLKPFDRERFEKTLTRVEERLLNRAQAEMSGDLRAFLSTLSTTAAPTHVSRFPVRANGEIYFIRVEDVDWIDAEGNYVALHAAGRRHLVRDTIKSLEDRLDPAKFVRVHRSAIINVDRLRKLQPYFHGEYVITLQDGTTLTSSRTYSDRLRALLERG